jgi:GH15 family glucan-1,4-alpha-glucosidase
MASRIEDYAIIGDCETAALVSRNGSIDWLCWPSFASDACFASLLGDEENGYWRIAPADGDAFALESACTITRRYYPDTLVLETTFEREGNIVKMSDFMPVRSGHAHIVRIVEGVSGQSPMLMELAVRFGYGQIVPWVTHTEDGVCCVAGPDMVLLRSPVETRGEGRKTVAAFTLEAGERRAFTLSYGDSAGAEPSAIDAEKSLELTRHTWVRWTAKTTDAGKYSEAVRRSMITLKAMTFRPTGGVVAAVTTSLPEALGGPRNWDYRYCWLRDSTFTLLALMNGGYYKEAEAWGDWLLRAIAGSPEQVQIMYGIRGERHLLEWEVPWLKGYENSAPVRIGNAAAEQLQLDIYGEVMDALLHTLHGIKKQRPQDFYLERALIDHLSEIWQRPDQGIWESRSGPQQFTYSKMMVWVALDRAIQIAETLADAAGEAPLDQWRATRQQIHDEVCARAYNKALGAFTQRYDSDQLDSSLLLMPSVGFLPASDPRVRGTIEAVEKKLMRNGLLLRYDTSASPDGLPPGEGAFLACSFWMVSCLKMIGRDEDARALFDRLLALRNDVGLLSEEYDVDRNRQVGNFPQAFSHIALVNAAFELENPDTRRRHHRKPQTMPANAQHQGANISELEPHLRSTAQQGKGSN